MTRYGSMYACAKVPGMPRVAKLLGGILQKEKAADGLLWSLAEGSVSSATA